MHDGRVDVSYVRLPVDESGLSTVHILDEPRVAMLPADHALARRDSLRLVELADEHLVQDPAAVPEWAATGREVYAHAHTHAPGHALPKRSLSPSVEEKLELVAMGRGIAIFPLSTAQFYRRPDVAFVAVDDIEPSRVSLAWEAGRRSALVDQFVELARQLT